jgi:hypothetical protein
VIPPAASAAFVAHLELVCDTYAEPPDPAIPLICCDETSVTLQADRHAPLPARPGDARREDPEYVRGGSANLFVAYAPHLGWRHVSTAPRRTAVDWAVAMRAVIDGAFPTAQRIIVVCDNLNIHRISSFYAAFGPEEARRLARIVEFRFTPVHGSWLNMAEFEISVLKRQVLSRRLGDLPTVTAAVAAWETARNTVAAPAQWQFTTEQARVRLPALYPDPGWTE